MDEQPCLLFVDHNPHPSDVHDEQHLIKCLLTPSTQIYVLYFANNQKYINQPCTMPSCCGYMLMIAMALVEHPGCLSACLLHLLLITISNIMMIAYSNPRAEHSQKHRAAWHVGIL